MAIIGAAISAGLSAYSAYQAYETHQDEKSALKKQEEIYQNNLQEKVRKTIGQQKASFLASGISLTSETAKYTLDDTVTQGNIESERISDYYSTLKKQSAGTARASYISSLGSLGSSAGSAYGSFSGVK